MFTDIKIGLALYLDAIVGFFAKRGAFQTNSDHELIAINDGIDEDTEAMLAVEGV